MSAMQLDPDGQATEGTPCGVPANLWRWMRKEQVEGVLMHEDELPKLPRDLPWTPVSQLENHSITGEPAICAVVLHHFTVASVHDNAADKVLMYCTECGLSYQLGQHGWMRLYCLFPPAEVMRDVE